MLLEIDFIEEMRTIYLDTTVKWCPKLCSTIPLSRENRFNPFDSVPLVTLRFELSLHQKRMTSQNFLQNKQRDVR